MAKLTFIAGALAGYVLGARAGRERYEQIKAISSKVWTSAPVERRKADLRVAAKSKAAPAVADLVSNAAKAAGEQLRAAGMREPKHVKSVPGEVLQPLDRVEETAVVDEPVIPADD